MEDEDFLLALRLQEQFDRETVTDGDSPSSKKRRIDASGRMDVVSRRRHEPERPLSIVDEAWETLDPNPDARAMFLQFNDMFFWGKLTGVEVKWSARGVCSYEGRGGLCSIRLSEPLLKLRPRKDLVETLLHEMIHALLFVTQNDRDRDGHGPEFCKHMNRINQASGTHISVYHSFHDEVDVYRQHWWRCDGPCQNRKPFFGYVKRAMNRPPSARDPWWPDHRRTCGGTYTKVKEPENFGKKNKGEKSKDAKPAADSSKTSKATASSSAAGSGSQDIRNIIPFSGRGFLLGGNAQQASSGVQTEATFTPNLPSVEESGINEYKKHGTSESNVLRKKSVSNTKAFININGSPVRVSKANSHTVKQKTVLDLFSNVHVWSSEKRTSTTDALSKLPAGLKRQTPTSVLDSEPVGKSNPINNHPSSSSKGPKPASNEPFLSKYFRTSDSGNPEKVESRASSNQFKNTGRNWNLTNTTLSSSQGSISSSPQVSTSASESGSSAPRAKKRPWEEHNSPPILDYFQPVSKTSRSEVKQEEETPLQISVCCPVCHAKVPENTINQHLDSCLS